ncbi:MAG: hypothetical protein DRH12_03185 [Deltaproteobacteria bacterium]|nr:MAG: hypothetical protein DRH12_03185 [Deltaproteobacteria bacterium]
MGTRLRSKKVDRTPGSRQTSPQHAPIEIAPIGESLSTVSVPAELEPIFLRAQSYVRKYFREKKEVPGKAQIEVSGERYILVRAASMSKEFFDLVTSLYQDRGIEEARRVASGFLFDMAHAIGKADARSFYLKMNVSKPVEKLSAGPIHFAYTGWAFVKILPDSHPSPDENYLLIYDHPFSFEADTWFKSGEKSDFPVCIMNAGYSSGWCEESFGLPLVAVEIECQAKGDEHCRFVMAPPSRIEEYLSKYSPHRYARSRGGEPIAIPEFFQRKRLEEELIRHRDHLGDLVKERTERLTRINERLQREITVRAEAEKALQKSETMLRAIFDQTFQFIAVLKLDGSVIKVNKTAMDFVNAKEEEINGRPFWKTPWWAHSPKEQERLKRAIKQAATGELVRFETEHSRADGKKVSFDFSVKPVRDTNGKIALLIAEGRDITALKSAVEDLRAREMELQVQSKRLEEANVALKVLLKQMENKKREDEESVLSNVRQLVFPYLQRLKSSNLDRDQRILLDMIENNLGHITSPMVRRLSSSVLNLTPMEIRISQLVREGLSNKEIAEVLGTSLNTVTTHRYKIRTKLGLKNKGINLRSYLMSLEE